MVALLTTLFMVKMSQGEAAPVPPDPSKIPHYYGPNPNWALSPLTLPDAAIAIETAGTGSGAKATAAVDGNGALTGITVTDPGSGYVSGAVTVSINGAGSGATADAVVTATGSVTGITVGANGAGYKSPVVTITGAATTYARATAYGGVDTLVVGDPGSGYTFPTVDFDAPDDPNGTQATAHADFDPTTGAITALVIDNAGSGYSSAPHVVIRDGTIEDPIRVGGAGATASATVKVLSVALDAFGSGYTAAPTVTIADDTGTGSGANATATVDSGGVTRINLTAAGTGYLTPGGIKKFQDALPGLCNPAAAGSCPDWRTSPNAKFIPLAVPFPKIYDGINADEYHIAVVQYRTKFSSSLETTGTLVRGYVQLETPENAAVSQHFPLTNELVDGTKVDIVDGDGVQYYGVTAPQWLGPTIAATKDKPVRVVFYNLLPIGVDGNVFMPTDTTLMGSGDGPVPMSPPFDDGTVYDEVRNPVCTDDPQDPRCFKQNRATLHLHGGTTPWISDGTPHQWITPALEDTQWPQGVSVEDVPDMDIGKAVDDGIQTFYYTNQQSARLMFYHDHAWGITRLNVHIGEAAGYLISDDTEKALIASNTIPNAASTIPLIVQDRTFVPQDSQLYDTVDASGTVTNYGQDPTWNETKWGGYGNFWYHHVYMPAQNPGSPTGGSSYGRWMYGPWFWPPATPPYPPIANPYYDENCNLAEPATWQYQEEPWCEPQLIPGTPNISAGMEQFNDTPIVNGVAYPEVTLEPKTYRMRILNAANDRSFNFQWYIADPSTGTNSEVALNPAELAAAQTDPNVFPTPVQGPATAGPDWIQIGSEGGFLPAPTLVDGQQPITFITNPARFDVGNVDLHSLVLAPAERADVIVDFSQFAGQTLILYNDAPAAYPARIPTYDYYTGAPDLVASGGAPTILPGWGPNTRTVMRVNIAASAPAAPFDFAKLRNAFRHSANGTGVFESSQHPIIVGQAAYNSAYGSSFSPASNCNPVPNMPNPAFQICDGFVRVNDTMGFGFNTLKAQTTKMLMPLQSKAIHDEMNATIFDEFGRMQANLGVEMQPATAATQNGIFYPYVNPSTELIDGTSLPKNAVTYDADGNPVSDIRVTPISNPNDGTQIWRITHNGVDTHPVHFHLFDVQIVNRVTWDNIIIPTEPSELGWKETVRVSPLEDTIVAQRPVIPEVPWELPNAVRDLNPMDVTGSTARFNRIDPAGVAVNITNVLVNFGAEYVYHCHMLSHEEMDMMRPVSLALPPVKASIDGYAVVADHVELTFHDNSITETSFIIQRNDGTGWVDAGTIVSPLADPNTHRILVFTDPAVYSPYRVYLYRVYALNTIGYGTGFPQMTVRSVSDTFTIGDPPAAPTGLTATPQAGSEVLLRFTDNATDESGFTVQRRLSGGTWADLATLPANTAVNPANTGIVTYTDTTVVANSTYDYRVRADKGAASSTWSNTATAAIGVILTVTSPNGGETWFKNSTHNVTFTTSPAAPTGTNFRLQLYDSTGAKLSQWISPLIPAVAAQTNYTSSWTITQSAGTHWRVRVYYYNAGGVQSAVDTSNADLTIADASVLAVTSPNGGETWFKNSTHNVTFTTSPAVPTGTNFRLQLYDSTGAKLSQWISPLIPAVAARTSYTSSWTITQGTGTNWRVRLYFYDAGGVQSAVDTSNADFTIADAPVLTVTSPNGGESWIRRSTHDVTFTTSPAVPTGTNFRLQLYDSTGARLSQWISPLIPAVAARTDYTRSWTITQSAGTRWRVRLYFYDAGGVQSAVDTSNADFTIAP
jgi:FtsP/CotA-like multicopper oxidase with cupredoxin domain/uncharacterized protein YcfL